MKNIFRVFIKDLNEFIHSIKNIFFIIIFPGILIVFVGQLSIRQQPVKVLICGKPKATQERAYDDTIKMLKKLSRLRITVKESYSLNPLEALQEGHYDILLNIKNGKKRYYIKEVDPFLIEALQKAVAEIERVNKYSVCENKDIHSIVRAVSASELGLTVDQKNGESPLRQIFYNVKDIEMTDVRTLNLNDREQQFNRDLARDLLVLVNNRASILSSYFSGGDNRSTAFIPRTIALIVSFIPYLISILSLIREKESHTFEIMLSAPGTNAGFIFVGKCLLPLVVGIFIFIMMLTLTQWFYGIYVKDGLLIVVGYIIPVILSSTLIGLGVSVFTTNQSQAILTSAIYFLSLTLLTGFFFPIQEASELIRLCSNFLPTTFLNMELQYWVFGGKFNCSVQNLKFLGIQNLVFGLIAISGYRQFLSRI